MSFYEVINLSSSFAHNLMSLIDHVQMWSYLISDYILCMDNPHECFPMPGCCRYDVRRRKSVVET